MPPKSDLTTPEILGTSPQSSSTTEVVAAEPLSWSVTLASAAAAGVLIFVLLGTGPATTPTATASSPEPRTAIPMDSTPISNHAEANRFDTLRDLHWENRTESWSRAEANRFDVLSDLGGQTVVPRG